MASFLSPNYVPEFSPAISTIPIDLYGKVIMQKQAEYNQGVQRTQAYIQNVTGLEMGREQDQQYYNQKVGEYKQKIQGLLTSDFSAPNVVMETSSISSQLYNDKRIKNSVMSRLYEKDWYQQVQKAQQDGTYAPENADPGMQAIVNWKQGDENATLGKMNYTPFDAYSPRLQAHLKAINPDIRYDSSSPVGEDGKRLPYVIKEGKIVAVDDAKVIAGIDSFFEMDASARNQRNLTTAYYSRNISDEQARDSLRSSHEEAIRSIDNGIKFRENLLVTQSQDSQRSAQLKAEIDQLRSNRVKREKNYQQDINDFVSNPLQVKANLYNRQQRRQLADLYTYEQEVSKIIVDPSWEAVRQVNQDTQNQENWEAEYKLAQDAERRLQGEADRKAAKEASGASGLPPFLPENMVTLDPSFATPEKVDERLQLEMNREGQDLWKFVYEASTREENGVMVSANDNLIQKNGNVYSLRPGVDVNKVSDVYYAMEKEYRNGRLNATPRVMDLYSERFDGADESKGHAKMMKIWEEKQTWDTLKRQAGFNPSLPQRGRDPNYVNIGVGGDRPLTANSNILGRLFNTDPNVKEGQVYSENFKKWTSSENVRNYAKLYSESKALPSIPITKAKDEEAAYNFATNAVTRIAESYFGGKSSEIEKYKKAIGKSVGYNVSYDPVSNQLYASINTLEEGVPAIAINYQQAISLGGKERVDAMMNPRNNYSSYDSEIQRNGGTTDPRSIRLYNAQGYDFNYRIEDRDGVKYLDLKYRPSSDQGASYRQVPKSYTQGIYTYQQIMDRLDWIKNANQSQIESILNLK